MLIPVTGLKLCVNPYAKIFYWVRETDWGCWPVTGPANYRHPMGYKLEYPAKCFERITA